MYIIQFIYYLVYIMYILKKYRIFKIQDGVCVLCKLYDYRIFEDIFIFEYCDYGVLFYSKIVVIFVRFNIFRIFYMIYFLYVFF